MINIAKRIKWDKEKIDFIIKKYTSKQMNTYQLADYFGCSNDTISRRLKENNIQPKIFYEDLTGHKFGKLTVLKKSKKSGQRLYWDCKCDCGNFLTVKGDALRQGLQQSCGCINSKNENLIANLLRNNNIDFIQQYSFNDLVSDNNKKLRFDFAIIKENKLQYLIEYDGEQHFLKNVSKTGWNTLENFKIIQKRDIQKNNYCLKNNIPLIRIPYTHKNFIKIEDLLLEKTKFLYQKEDD